MTDWVQSMAVVGWLLSGGGGGGGGVWWHIDSVRGWGGGGGGGFLLGGDPSVPTPHPPPLSVHYKILIPLFMCGW